MTKAKGGYRTEPHYYSERLIRKLEQIRSLPAAVVDAPSGYGKTTAVRDLLEALPASGTAVHWFIAMNEAPAVSFLRLCRVLDGIDRRAAQRLMSIGLPNAATAGDACDAFRSIQCRAETYLVIDNFQYVQNVIPESFQKTLIEHGVKSLHLVLITQRFAAELLGDAISRGALHITADDLRLSAKDIRRFYALWDSTISDENAEAIARYSEGWVIAVYLGLRHYRDTGLIAETPDIFLLMERLAWNPLNGEQQTFLLRLSPFESVTARQACALLGAAALPDYALAALRSPFIRCTHREERYDLHPILREVLSSKRRERGPAFERECLVNAGDLCLREGAPDRAFMLYERAGDMERALAVDLSPLLFERLDGELFPAVALRILRRCPDDIRRRHHLSMLRISWSLLAAQELQAFDGLMEALDAELAGDEPETALLRGEWLLLSCWRQAPNFQKMIDLARRAEPLFGGRRSRVILPGAPWCFGNLSQLSAFHRVPGEADREADLLEEFLTIYTRLTGGHGAGADVLFRGEIAHYRGDLGAAEILLHKAGLLAEACGQSIIQLGVALHQAEIAVERSDMEGWQRTIAAMERAASGPGNGGFVLPGAVDILRSLLFIELGHQKRIANWLKDGKTEERALPAMRTNALFTRLNYLMHEEEYARLAGMAEAGIQMLNRGDPVTETLYSFQAGAGYLRTGNAVRAEAFVRHAAELALPDGFAYLFAVYDFALAGLPEKCVRAEYPGQLDRFRKITARFYHGYDRLHAGIAAAELSLDLTAREREVADLAAAGLRNSEIAEKLNVSENTVRAHLRAVFQKMDIDRRSRLADKLK